MQIVAGPRQAGKTTLVRQVLDASKARTGYASADEPPLRGHEWIEQQWNRARIAARETGKQGAIGLEAVQGAARKGTVCSVAGGRVAGRSGREPFNLMAKG